MDPAELGAGDRPALLRRDRRRLSCRRTRLRHAYGGKAANLGFLAHRSCWAGRRSTGTVSSAVRLRPGPGGLRGPAVRSTATSSSTRRNVALRAELDAFVAAEKAGTLSPADRAPASLRGTDLLHHGDVPAGRARRDQGQARPGAARGREGQGPLQRQRRGRARTSTAPGCTTASRPPSASSDNPDGSCAFEIDGSDAATRATVKRKVSPQSVACAIKGVYASLWNKRAVEERSFARIDHATVAMGLSVVPAYDAESDGRRERRRRDAGDQHRRRLRLLAVGPGRATTSSPTPTRAPPPR